MPLPLTRLVIDEHGRFWLMRCETRDLVAGPYATLEQARAVEIDVPLTVNTGPTPIVRVQEQHA